MMYLENMLVHAVMRRAGKKYVQRMDDARNVTQDREQDIDEQICAAATLEEHAERW